MQDAPDWHVMPGEQVAAALETDLQAGLSPEEAGKRLEKYGENRLPRGKRRGITRLFVDQFRDLMIQILLLAALVAGFIGEPLDAVAILVIVLLNAAIGVVQQYRAENALMALREMAAPTAQVIRGGSFLTIPASDLVPGDIALLESGAVVPADMRLLEAQQLQVDESMLTGESGAAEKLSGTLSAEETSVGDRTNMAYRSTLATRGRARGVVVATGMATEVGGIAELLSTIESMDSPLQQRLAAFTKRLAGAILGICALIFIAGLLRGEPWLLMLLTTVSLAVAAIPEALPAVVSISLALGARRMSGNRALVRSLPAVETLGSVSFICSDKTGTLTMNRMNAEVVLSGAGRVTQLPHRANDLPDLWQLLGCCLALSNDVRLTPEHLPAGDPTEIALFEMAETARFLREPLERELPRINEVPFTSERKLMTTFHREDGGILAFSKGAPEILIERCNNVMLEDGEQAIDTAHWVAAVEQLSEKGYRVLALACKRLVELPETLEDAEQGLTLLGVVALIDPPREGVLGAIKDCNTAGITSVMITGDHPATAREIARRLGIIHDGDQVVTGAQLDDMTDEQLTGQVVDTRVYARVSPAQKIRLVRALQERGQFIAMTGDGVNDAPALRQADIGVAMGQKGTDVARQAGQMILLDDNFATIVAAVREGRRIFDNIRKFVKYTMTSNSGEIWTLALAPLFGLPLPLLPIHILWINLVTDGLPGLALTSQVAEGQIMTRPPRPPNERLFAGGMWQHILLIGLLIGALALGVQAWALSQALPHWQTMVFTVLTFSQLVHVLVIRNDQDALWATGLFQNPALIGAVLLTVLLQLALIYLPVLNGIFHTSPLPPMEMGLCLALPLIVLLVVEAEKWLIRRKLIYLKGPGDTRQ
jgi:Ca2+-transporting ATPase